MPFDSVVFSSRLCSICLEWRFTKKVTENLLHERSEEVREFVYQWFNERPVKKAVLQMVLLETSEMILDNTFKNILDETYERILDDLVMDLKGFIRPAPTQISDEFANMNLF